MENNLINQIKEYVTPDFISSLGVTTNESEHNINKALDVSIPALLMGLFTKEEGTLQGILTKVRSLFTGESMDFSSQINGISSVADVLLGEHKNATISAIAEHAGINETSANAVMQTGALGIFGYLKNLVPDFDLDGIKNFIASHKSEVASLLPSGLSLAGLTNWFQKSPPPKAAPDPVVDKTHEAVNQQVNDNYENKYAASTPPEGKDKGGSSILRILIPLIIGIALIIFLYRNCGNQNNDQITDPASQDSLPKTETTTTVTTETTTPTREMLKVELPDGRVLDAFKGGIEDQLVAFLKKGDYKNMTEAQLKDTWFDFDNLNFETNSAKITEDTKIQVDNIAAILTAFPDVKIKIGGYTDKTGNEAANKKLSMERATAVKVALTDKGKGAQVVGAEGYGSEFAKYEASAPDSERALDRRVSVSVRTK